MTEPHPALALAAAVADQLADPHRVSGTWEGQRWWRQSLAHGAPGIALLHIERAAAGLASWQRAHDWLTYAAHGNLTTGSDSHLYYGAPALAHALTSVAAGQPGAYQRALDRLDRAIAADAHRRVAAANARIDAGRLPQLAEFDVIRGITGLGAYLLRRDAAGETTRAVLDYLVRLTDDVTIDGQALPGWWTELGPTGRASDRFPGGHGNNGLAHGIAGPLALLALATLRGITVPGHHNAIGRICAWLDRWRTDTDTGVSWPYWLDRAHHATGRPDRDGAKHLGWCYGTAGLARAQYLAALATGDTARRDLAENALIHALSDPAHSSTTDITLCHGRAGLAHIAAATAADASPPAADQLRSLTSRLLDTVQPEDTDPDALARQLLTPSADSPGLLEGAAGVALAVIAPSTTAKPRSGWDSCLLIA
ncbi:lanthionine synthetase C family protein [Frankia sp. Cpl3]|uniref:lanthionine synthetase C family protein n=1 Tax=Parafrankia colletiae TaxID=573497 RepID=UPI000B02D146|nr:lanthionine synthetase C family protein [Parafrankia colletiae]MCK9903569.1 lanthionine synthetase C family protein [Frankia sp. Cpl3]